MVHSATMPLFQVVVLAIIQGITEFLPISSTAHLALAPWLLGWADPGLTFDVALHVGTLLAILVYFFRTWLQIIAEAIGIHYGEDEMLRRNPGLLWLLAAASIPIGIFGFLFGKQAETTWRSPFVIGAMLLTVGVLMWLGERAGTRKKDMSAVSFTDSLVIGAAQAVAIIPGTSRSGITITAGLFRNLDRMTAARFSFLLSAPAIAAAAGKAFHDLMKHGGIPPAMHTPFLLGIAISAVSGMVVIAFLLRFLQRHTLYFFVYYRIIFGIIVIALASSRPPAG
jgi:undecaprenyl-diphosphatase